MLQTAGECFKAIDEHRSRFTADTSFTDLDNQSQPVCCASHQNQFGLYKLHLDKAEVVGGGVVHDPASALAWVSVVKLRCESKMEAA